MSDTAIATIDLNALLHNLMYIKTIMPTQKILPMVKGNAYGHGLVPIASAFPAGQLLGVANLTEALRLRKAGIKHPILVMRGFCNTDELSVFINDPGLTACLHDPSQLTLLKNLKTPINRQLDFWLKIDTGMHRLGFSYPDAHEVYKTLKAMPFVAATIKTFTHLADADNVETTVTKAQLARFNDVALDLPGEKSVLNSAGILAYPEAAYDWIRPGVALYGASPFPLNSPHYKTMQFFQPVMTFSSRLIAIKRVLPGETVGYNCQFHAEREMLIGVVGVGYADGYPRQAITGTPVLIHGKRCALVGRVSMDMITVDISALQNPTVGDVVTLWGRDLSVNEIARYANSIPHELLSQVTGRVQYIYSPLNS